MQEKRIYKIYRNILNHILRYVPVFDLTMYESQLIYHQTRVKSILSMVISISSTFYNPTIALWEPIIERSSFALDMSLTAKSNPKKYVILEMNSP